MVGERWKDTPIDSQLRLELDMNKSKDVQLLKNLASFAFPPIDYVKIDDLSKAVRKVKRLLTQSLGQLRHLHLNDKNDLLDGSEWVEAIVMALPRVKKEVQLWNFSFSKEQVEAIVDNSLHLEYLGIIECKLRKWCYLRCDCPI
jgi:hypothetical protein